MIYLILSAASAFFGMASGLGPTTLLRPLLDAVSPLSPSSVAMLATMATLCAALLSAFFALGEPLPLHPDELILLAAGAVIGGVLGDLAAARFMRVIDESAVLLLQNALLATIIALPSVYFATLARTVRPLALSRLFSFPVALGTGLIASFLAFGAEPLSLMLYFLLFDAENEESSVAALTIALCSMSGKLVTMLIRQRFALPEASTLIWLLPGALLGALLAMAPAARRGALGKSGDAVLRLSLFTSLINIAAAIL
ncbi:MAG: TSUP family transporter [Clostridia bacterium]|nr:TSUP family transporter [Clostridia bacterium]